MTDLPDWARVLDALEARRPEVEAALAAVPPDPRPLVWCAECGAGWYDDGLPCWWCEQRLIAQHEAQGRLERDRFVELCERITDGDVRAVGRAVEILKLGRMDARQGARQLARAVARGITEATA